MMPTPTWRKVSGDKLECDHDGRHAHAIESGRPLSARRGRPSALTSPWERCWLTVASDRPSGPPGGAFRWGGERTEGRRGCRHGGGTCWDQDSGRKQRYGSGHMSAHLEMRVVFPLSVGRDALGSQADARVKRYSTRGNTISPHCWVHGARSLLFSTSTTAQVATCHGSRRLASSRGLQRPVLHLARMVAGTPSRE